MLPSTNSYTECDHEGMVYITLYVDLYVELYVDFLRWERNELDGLLYEMLKCRAAFRGGGAFGQGGLGDLLPPLADLLPP